MYQVVLLNDDYTPMEFVVLVIQEFFGKDLEAATQIMLKIHLDGKGICGVYSRDVAATKGVVPIYAYPSGFIDEATVTLSQIGKEKDQSYRITTKSLTGRVLVEVVNNGVKEKQ